MSRKQTLTLICLASTALLSAVSCGPRSEESPASKDNRLTPSGVVAVTVHVKGLRDTKGLVILSVCANADCDANKDKDSSKIYAYQIGMANASDVTLELRNFAAGKYAIYLLHDENSNHVMDLDPQTSAPLEGFGFSKNPAPTPGKAPKFDDIALAYDGTSPVETTICARYVGDGQPSCP